MKLGLFDKIKNRWDDDSMEIEYISGEQHFVPKHDGGDENEFHDRVDKIFSFHLSPEKKQKIANDILENSDVDKLYWIQLMISCMLATLWLLSNSIPVIIWSMLVSPILTPIQSFAFAITCGKKHLYMKSLKILCFSILIAIASSFLVCYLVPFASITEQVLLRWTPTVIDLVIALLSGIIAFIFLWSEKLEESIVWIAIAVSLMPPLASVWIGLHFMNFEVAQWTFLLFITNLVGILVVWILVFFIFGFKPTNRAGKKRTDITLALVWFFICLITVPLWKSMSQITESQRMNTLITHISNNYFDTLDEWIVMNELSFRNTANDTVRIISKLDVPTEFSFTNLHKEELTKKLSEALWKSVELDLDIVEISSVYIDKWEDPGKILLSNINKYLSEKQIILVDSKNLLSGSNFLFLNLYTDVDVDKNEVNDHISDMIQVNYPSAKLVLQWQDDLQKPEDEVIEKSQAEIDLEKQFSLLFTWWEILSFDLDYLERVQDDEYEKYAELVVEFMTPYSSFKTHQLLSWWKEMVKEYLWMDVVLKVKFEEINLLEI